MEDLRIFAEHWLEPNYLIPGSQADLDGWYLTDNDANLTKWQFPSVELDPGEFLVVFASGENREDPNELHTNFKLDGGGEYLALVAADGNTIVHEYAPEYPEQLTDISQPATLVFRNTLSQRHHGHTIYPVRRARLVRSGLVINAAFTTVHLI